MQPNRQNEQGSVETVRTLQPEVQVCRSWPLDCWTRLKLRGIHPTKEEY